MAVALLAGLAAWFRIDPTSRATLWAEDGRVFLQDASHAAPLSTLLRPYDGYLHLVPRIGAELVTATVPVQYWALAVTAFACVVAGLVAAAVYVLSRDVVAARPWRLALAAITVVVPVAPVEVLGNLANLHWLLLWLTPWLLLSAPRSRAGQVGFAVLAVLIGLSEVQALYFLPLIGWRLRDPRRWPARSLLVMALAVQVVMALTSERSPAAGALPGVRALAAGFLVNSVGVLWIGTESAIGRVFAAAGWGIFVALAVPSLVALAAAVRLHRPISRLAAVALPVSSGVVWCAAVVVNRPPLLQTDGDPAVLRYATIVSMLVAAGLVLALAEVDWRAGRLRWAAAAVLVALVTVAAANVRPEPQNRSEGPVWAEEVREAVTVCAGSPAPSDDVLEIAPDSWAMAVPCSLVEAG